MHYPVSHFYVVDDDLPFGKSLQRLLNARGLPADYFGSAQCFLDSVPSDTPGYAIVDVHMPDCDGFALMDKMREQHYSLSVIMITGQPQADNRELAMQKGAVGFLQKPFSEVSLLELIEKDRND